MSFFQIPISAVNFQPQERTIPRQFSSQSNTPVNQRYYQSNDYPLQYLRNQQSVERNAPFKVYIFDGKFNHNLNSASNVLRFEIDSNNERSFELFDRILREHSIDMRQYELHYVDEEDDLVALANYRDFKFMLRLMNGKLTKIVCEKKSVQSKPPQCALFNRIIPQQEQPKPQCFFAQFPQPRETQKKQESAQHSFENMIEQAFRSAFTNESAQPRQQPQPATSSTPAEATPQQKPRVRRIEISLADLLGIPKRSEEESKKEESKHEEKKESTPLSFRDLILQRMNEMKEEESKNQESIQEKKEVEKPITPTSEPAEEKVSEPEIVFYNHNTSTSSPNMTTSLLLSNLIEESTVPEQTESDNKSIQLSSQELENQDPIIESIPEEQVEEQTVKTTIPHKYQKELKLLNDMGFSNHILNVNLLNKYGKYSKNHFRPHPTLKCK